MTLPLKLSISKARRRLHALIEEIQRDPATWICITIRNEPVADLRAIEPQPEPGEAAGKLLVLAR